MVTGVRLGSRVWGEGRTEALGLQAPKISVRWECEQYTRGVYTGVRSQQTQSPGGRRLPPFQAHGSASSLAPLLQELPAVFSAHAGPCPPFLLSGIPAPPSTPGHLSFYTQLRHHLPPGRLGLCRPSDLCVDPTCIFTFPPNIHPGSSQAQGVCPFFTPEPSTKPGPSHHP